MAIVALAEDGKASVVVAVTADLIARFNAVDLVRVASATLGGKGGGGRPDMAQAGGPDGAKRARRWRRSRRRCAGGWGLNPRTTSERTKAKIMETTRAPLLEVLLEVLKAYEPELIAIRRDIHRIRRPRSRRRAPPGSSRTS